jgi:hypothetical protein
VIRPLRPERCLGLLHMHRVIVNEGDERIDIADLPQPGDE